VKHCVGGNSELICGFFFKKKLLLPSPRPGETFDEQPITTVNHDESERQEWAEQRDTSCRWYTLLLKKITVGPPFFVRDDARM
jgi:hypothetical protein